MATRQPTTWEKLEFRLRPRTLPSCQSSSGHQKGTGSAREPGTGGPAATTTQPGGGWAGGAWEGEVPGNDPGASVGPQGEGRPRPPPCLDGLGAPGSGRLVFRNPLREEREEFHRLPRVVGGGAALPAYQVVGPGAEGLAVDPPAPERSQGRVGRAGPGENSMAEAVVGRADDEARADLDQRAREVGVVVHHEHLRSPVPQRRAVSRMIRAASAAVSLEWVGKA